MPRLALVISAAGSIESLEATLVSVLENRPADSEVVVALTRPYDDPYELAGEVRFVAPRRRATPLAAVNAALATVQAPVLHLLAAGCLVSDGWADAALARFDDRSVGAVVPWTWDAEQSGKLLAVGVGYHRRGHRYLIGQGADGDRFHAPGTVIGPASFAAFYRKAALDFLGGYSRQLTLRTADADLALAMAQAGLTVAVEPRSKVTAPAEVDCHEGSLAEARATERMFWRNRQTASTPALLGHGGAALWDVLKAAPRPTSAARLVGRLWGSLEWGSHARHRLALQELAARGIAAGHDAARPSDQQLRVDGSHRAPSRADVPQSERQRTR